ncbi:MAG: hypothetical protein RIQ93_986 [Verrucomicrobiota bacterium]|jgi:hypothetical protein
MYVLGKSGAGKRLAGLRRGRSWPDGYKRLIHRLGGSGWHEPLHFRYGWAGGRFATAGRDGFRGPFNFRVGPSTGNEHNSLVSGVTHGTGYR